MKRLLLGLMCLTCFSIPSYAINVPRDPVVEDFVKIKEISDSAIIGCETDAQKVLALSHFVHEKMCFDKPAVKSDGSRVIPADIDMLNTVERLESGYGGWCNHQVAVFMRLAEAQKIKTRMLYLLNKEGTASPHTIAEAFVDGKYVIVDPQMDLKGLYSRYEVLKNPSLLKNEEHIKARTTDEKELDEWVGNYTNPALYVYGLE